MIETGIMDGNRRTGEVLDDRYQQLVELAPDGILVHDGEVILWANAAALRLAGATHREELVGHPVGLVLDPPYLRAAEHELLGTSATGTYTSPVRDTFKRLDGSTVEVEVRAVVVLSEGHPAAHLVIRDVTERLALEVKARQLELGRLRAERAESVAALAGGVAHELNNMIAVILGHAAFVIEEGSASPTAIADIQQIMKAAERAAAVTRQLLAFSSRALNRPEVVDVGVALRETEESLRGLLGPAHRLELRLGDIPSARIDVEQLAQVIQHLVANARDATPHGGHLVITTTTAHVDEPIPAGGQRVIPPGRYGRVTVHDDGIGIDPAVRPRIFEPFFTTKPLGEGTGLGLAAVQGILAQNAGFITVESEPGSGTTFTIHLPEIERPEVGGDVISPRATAAEPPPSSKPVVQYSVLVVDDEPGMRAVATRALGRAGLNVTVAVDGVDALEIIERDGPPDLLLTDLRMPRMGGVELAGIFRERWPDVPVLMMSGYSVEFLEVSGTLTDRTQLIQKPFDATELVARLHSALGRDR